MRVKKYTKYQKIEVCWVDTVERSGWRSVSKALQEGGVQVHNIGYFLGNHKGILNLASSLSADEECNVTSIPWGTIYDVRELEYNNGEC